MRMRSRAAPVFPGKAARISKAGALGTLACVSFNADGDDLPRNGVTGKGITADRNGLPDPETIDADLIGLAGHDQGGGVGDGVDRLAPGQSRTGIDRRRRLGPLRRKGRAGDDPLDGCAHDGAIGLSLEVGEAGRGVLQFEVGEAAVAGAAAFQRGLKVEPAPVAVLRCESRCCTRPSYSLRETIPRSSRFFVSVT